MTFLLERFDVIKQFYDKTGLYVYHDTVSTSVADVSSGKTGDTLATIVADGFFNPVAEVLQVPGGLIMVTATDKAAVYKVTQVYGADGKPAVKLVEAKATV